jgi:hypothetical protein
LIADPGNANSLAGRLVEFYRDRAMTKRFGENARAAGLTFDRALQVRRYFDLFQSIVEAPAPAVRAQAREA